MKTFLSRHKWLVGGLVGTIPLVIIAYVGLQFAVSQYLSAQSLEKRLADGLNRDAKIGSVSFSFWSGISLSGVEISESSKFDGTYWISANNIYLQPEWFELIWGNIVIADVTVRDARAYIRRKQNGEWNVSETSANNNEPSGEDTDQSKKSSGQSDDNLTVNIDHIQILESSVVYHDLGREARLELPVTRGYLRNFSLKQGFDIGIEEASIGKGSLEGDCHFNFLTTRLNCESLSVRDLSIDPFLPFFSEQNKPGDAMLESRIHSSLKKVTASETSVDLKGDIEATNIPEPVNGQFSKFVNSIKIGGNLSYDLLSSQLQLRLNTVNLGPLRLPGTVEGTLEPPWQNPVVDAQLQAGSMELSPLLEAEPWTVVDSSLSDLSVNGSLKSMNGSINGPIDDTNYKLTGVFSNVSLNEPRLSSPVTLQSVNTTVSNTGVSTTVPSISLGQQRIEGLATMDYYFGDRPVTYRAQLEGSNLDVEEIHEMVSPFVEDYSLVTNVSGELERLNLDVQGEGSQYDGSISTRPSQVIVKSGYFAGNMTLKQGILELTPRSVTIDDLKGDYAKGEFSVNGRVPVPVGNQSQDELDVRGALSNMNATRLTNLLPSGTLPDKTSVSGDISAKNIHAEGSVGAPQVSGTVIFEGNTIESTYLDSPVTSMTGSVRLNKDNVLLKNLQGDYNGQPISLSGQINRPLSMASETDLKVGIESIQVASLLSLAPDNVLPEGTEVTGPISLRPLRVSGPFEKPTVTGHLIPENMAVELSELDSSVDSLNGRIKLSENSFELDDLNGTFDGSPFSVTGDLPRPFSVTEPSNLTVSVDRLETNNIVTLIPDDSLPEEFKINGPVSLDGVNLKGPLNKPDITGRAQLDGVKLQTGYVTNSINELSGRLNLSSEEMVIPSMDGVYGSHSFSLSGSLSKPFSFESLLDVTVTSDSLPVEILLRELPEETLPQDIDAKGPVAFESFRLKGPVNNPEPSGTIQLRGLKLESGWTKHPIEKIEGDVDVQDKRIGFTELTGNYQTSSLRVNGIIPREFKNEQSIDVTINTSEFESKVLQESLPDTMLPERMSFDGSLKLDDLRIHGTIGDIKTSGRARLAGMRIQTEAFDESFQGLRGGLVFQSERVSIETLEGKYGRYPFDVSGAVPMSWDQGGNIELRGNLAEIPVRKLLALSDTPILPAGTDLSGPLTVKSFYVRGPALDPTVDGSITVGGMTLKPSFLTVPIESITGDITVTNNSVTVDKLTGMIEDNFQLALQGQILDGNPRQLDLKFNSDTIPVEDLRRWVRDFPDFPKNWKPGGRVSVNGILKGTPDDPEVNGTIDAPSLSMGKLKGTNARSDFKYSSGSLDLTSQTMNILGGQLSGRTSVTPLDDRYQLSVDHQVRRTKLGLILSTLAGVGERSSGLVAGRVELTGPLGQYESLSGPTRVNGDTLIFKDLPVFKNLSSVMEAGLTNVFDEGAASLISKVIRAGSGDKYRRLDRAFKDALTSKYDRGILDVDFQDGEGSIQKLTLYNEKLSIQGRGKIWLNGTLNVALSIDPKKPFMDRFESDSIRAIIGDGFPVIKVSGSVMNPKYNTDAVQKKLLSRYIQHKASDDDGDKKKDSKEKAAEKILNDILN